MKILTIENYIKEKQYTLATLGIFSILTFELSSSLEEINKIFALISGLVTQFLLISLKFDDKRKQTISLISFRVLLSLSSIAFPFWAWYKLPYFLNSINLSFIFWILLLGLAIFNHFIRKEEI